MQDISNLSSPNTEAIVVVAVCVLSAVFMVRFLIALLLEERRLIKVRRLTLRKSGRFSTPIRARVLHSAQAEVGETRISASSEHIGSSRLGIVRLSDKNIGRSTKLRWLLMALVISATLHESAEAAESAGQKDETKSPTQQSGQHNTVSAVALPAPSPLPSPAITGPLQGTPPIVRYGPGSAAWSITLTPTFQYGRFFTRGDLSFVRATSFTPGNAFGPTGANPNQSRGVMEAGFMF